MATIELPRFLIVFPALAISLLKAGWSLDAAIWLLYSVPLSIIIWAGTLYWWKRRRFVAVVATTVTLLAIFVLGLA